MVGNIVRSLVQKIDEQRKCGVLFALPREYVNDGRNSETVVEGMTDDGS